MKYTKEHQAAEIKRLRDSEEYYAKQVSMHMNRKGLSGDKERKNHHYKEANACARLEKEYRVLTRAAERDYRQEFGESAPWS